VGKTTRLWLAALMIISVVGSALVPKATASGTQAANPSAVTVIKRFGAALRVAPSSDARVKTMLGCGAYLHVIGGNAGWYKVRYVDAVTPLETGWVGKARVGDKNTPLTAICANAITFNIGQRVYTKVASGCLSLRVTPSRSAVYHYCVANYHEYVIVNGPIGVGADDWFEVTSGSTGTGWGLAQYLRPE
jgi:hypothetical protein